MYQYPQQGDPNQYAGSQYQQPEQQNVASSGAPQQASFPNQETNQSTQYYDQQYDNSQQYTQPGTEQYPVQETEQYAQEQYPEQQYPQEQYAQEDYPQEQYPQEQYPSEQEQYQQYPSEQQQYPPSNYQQPSSTFPGTDESAAPAPNYQMPSSAQNNLTQNMGDLQVDGNRATMPAAQQWGHQQHHQQRKQTLETQQYNRPSPTHRGMPSPTNRMPAPAHGMPPPTQTKSKPLVRPPLIPSHVHPCKSQYMQFTVNAMPNTDNLRLRSHLAYGAILQPLNDTEGEELPIVNFGTEVVRCKRCRTYINPYVTILSNGSRWRCNLCGQQNSNPAGYRAVIDQKHPELTHSSLEIVAPVEYMVRQPMPPVYVFLVDVSVAATKMGMLQILSETIKSSLDSILEKQQRTMIAFITFDSTVHFYSLKSTSTGPQMYVMPDLNDIFLPLPNDMLVNLEESRSQVDALLDSLPAMHAKTQDVESALGPALRAAMKLMSRIGGKLMLFLCGLPCLGVGRLTNRENPRLLGTSKEHTLLKPVDEFYHNQGKEFARHQICVDSFLFSEQYIDVSTISSLSHITGGECSYYSHFHPRVEGVSFRSELQRNLTRTTGWESVIRIRASKGIKLHRYYGNFSLRNADLLALSAVDCDKTFIVELKNEDALLSGNSICVQAALLYTTSHGERRIRVHTSVIDVTSLLHELFQKTNPPAILNLLTKQTIASSLGESFSKARDQARTKCISIMRTAQTACRAQGIPPKLEDFPRYISGLLKSMAVRNGTDIGCDLRGSVLSSLRSMGVSEMQQFFKPCMYALHQLDSNLGLDDGKGSITMPAPLRISCESLKADGLYLLSNGLKAFLRFGKKTPAHIIQSLLGVESLNNDAPIEMLIPNEEDIDSFLRRCHNIVMSVRNVHRFLSPLYIIKEGDVKEVVFLNMLYDDRHAGEKSLEEFQAFVKSSSRRYRDR